MIYINALSIYDVVWSAINKDVYKRQPWLFILLVMGLGVSATVGLFESIVAQLPIIMCFQSLILDMSGNVGTQSLAVAIRVLMDKQLSGKQKLSLILKESRVGLTLSLIHIFRRTPALHNLRSQGTDKPVSNIRHIRYDQSVFAESHGALSPS